MNNQQYLNVGLKAVKQSAPLFKKYFGHPNKVEKKNNNRLDLVTEIDRAIEKKIRATIGRVFPHHAILGEESGLSKGNDFTWVIDPIDGTTNYIQGVPECVISLALWDKNGPVVGIIYNPITGSLFHAQKGKGAFLNNKKIKVSQTKSIQDAFCAIGWNESASGQAAEFFGMVKKISRKIRILGTSALQLAYVAGAELDFFAVKSIKAWDFAAGVLIITEAGGRVTDWQGKPVTLSCQSLIASNGKLHKELLGQLR
jgi:myo-inositol-1(or 4)-monophosphatase